MPIRKVKGGYKIVNVPGISKTKKDANKTAPMTPKLLKAKSDKDKYLVPLSDLHIGGKTTNYEAIEKTIEFIKKNNAWVIALGDICEVATRTGRAERQHLAGR